MSDTVRYPLVLGLISLCSAAGLAFSYVLTRDEIGRQKAIEKNRAIAAAFGIESSTTLRRPPWTEVRVGEGPNAYSVYEMSDPKLGGGKLYAAEGAARGYSSKIEVIVAVDEGIRDKPDAARITTVRVVSQSETPGLGTQCQSREFQRQFEGLLLGRLELKKGAAYRVPGPKGDEQPIAAITGATITSNGVLRAIDAAIKRVREHVTEQPKPSDAGKAKR